MKKIYLLIAMMCFYTNAMASWYAGAGIGKVDVDFDDVSSFDSPVGIELIVGNDLNSYFSIEASYIDFGEANNTVAPRWIVSADAITLGALIKAPVHEGFDIFLKLGLNKWDAELREDGAGVIGEDDGSDMFYGLGVTLKTNDKVSFSARYNVYDFDGDDASMLSINIFVGF